MIRQRAAVNDGSKVLQTRECRRRPWWRSSAGLLAVAMMAAACADLDATTTAVRPADGGAIAETTAGSSTTTSSGTGGEGLETSGNQASEAAMIGSADARLGTTELGDVLVGPDGRSLYAFANDTQAASTCYGTCAEDWPPVVVDPDWDVDPSLDSGIFATTVRDDGRLQLVAGRWPLYYYVKDAAPGDVAGHGLGDVWFLVDPSGALLDSARVTGTESGTESGTGTGTGY